MPSNSGIIPGNTSKSNTSKSNSGKKPSVSSKSHYSEAVKGGGPSSKGSPNIVGSSSQPSLKRYREGSDSEASRGNTTDQSLSQLSALLDELTRDEEGTMKCMDILLGNSAIKNCINEHLMSRSEISNQSQIWKILEWTEWNNIRGAHALNSLAYLREKGRKQMISS